MSSQEGDGSLLFFPLHIVAVIKSFISHSIGVSGRDLYRLPHR